MTQFSFGAVASKPALRQLLGNVLPTVNIYDIGAMSEGIDRYDGLLSQELANVVGFEPNPPEFEKLQANKRAGKRYLPYFIGGGGPATFHITRYAGCSSLYEPDPAVINLFTDLSTILPRGNFAVTQKMAVQTRRLDDVEGLPPCDYMKIDVQGGELDVLKGAGSALGNAVVLEMEVEFIQLYKNQPLFGDIQMFLQEHHFVLHKFLDVAGRAMDPFVMEGNPCKPMSQVLWADAVFVRQYFDLSRWTDEQLLKAAMILYDTYCSHDLAHHLLKAYDQRIGGASAGRMTQALAHWPNVPTMYMNLKVHR